MLPSAYRSMRELDELIRQQNISEAHHERNRRRDVRQMQIERTVFYATHPEILLRERRAVWDAMLTRWNHRRCGFEFCRAKGWCRHREPEVEYAELTRHGFMEAL